MHFKYWSESNQKCDIKLKIYNYVYNMTKLLCESFLLIIFIIP